MAEREEEGVAAAEEMPATAEMMAVETAVAAKVAVKVAVETVAELPAENSAVGQAGRNAAF